MGKVRVVRVVIDTNVLIRVLLPGGVSGRLVSLWKSGRIQSLASQPMIDEALRILACPKLSPTPKGIELLHYEEILPWLEIVDVATGTPSIEDDMFLWCALDGKAEQIISGDAHLLQLQGFPVLILTPRQFLELVESDR